MAAKRLFVTLILIACGLGTLAAKEVNIPAVLVFTNGIKKTVTLLEQDDEKVTARLSTGKVETYKREEIQSIEWKLPPGLTAADDLLKKGEHAKALAKYEDTISKESNAWCVEQARFKKMQCCLVLGKYEEAVKEYLRILEASPKSEMYGRLPLPEGESAENAAAAKHLKTLADLAKDDFVKGMALGLTASTLAADKKLKDAEEIVKSMLVISNPKIQGFAKVLYGQIAVEKEDYAGAVKLITENLKGIPDPLLPAAYYWLGKAYFGKNDYEHAAISFLRAPTYMRGNEEIAGDCLYAGAKTFEKADRWRDAARLYADMEENFPGARHIQDAKETLEKLRKIGRGG